MLWLAMGGVEWVLEHGLRTRAAAASSDDAKAVGGLWHCQP